MAVSGMMSPVLSSPLYLLFSDLLDVQNTQTPFSLGASSAHFQSLRHIPDGARHTFAKAASPLGRFVR